MEVLNFIRQRRKYKNTIVLYAKFENKPFRETFFNVGESEFNELYNFVMAHKVKKKRYKYQSKLSLYGKDGRVSENIYFKDKKTIFNMISQIFHNGPYESWKQEPISERIRWEFEELDGRISEDWIEKFDGRNSNMDVLKQFVKDLKILSPCKERAIHFGNIRNLLHSFDDDYRCTEWYTWVDDQNVVNFQSDEFYWLDRLDSNLYTYGFQILDESFELSPIAKRRKKSSLQWGDYEGIVTRSRLRPFVDIRYVFEGLVFLDSSNYFCGLPSSVINSLKDADVLIENYKASIKDELTLKNEKMLRIIINNVPEHHWMHWKRDELYETSFHFTLEKNFLHFMLGSKRLSTNQRNWEKIILVFDVQTNRLKINDVFLQPTILTEFQQYKLSNFFNTRDPIWIKVQDFIMKYFIDNGSYERPDEEDVCSFHPLLIEMLPYLVLKKYTKFDNAPRIKFLNDTLDETDEVDHGGPSAEFLYLLAQSLFQPFDMSYAEVEEFKKYNVLDVDDATRFPKYASHMTSEEEKRRIIKAILKFFHFAAFQKELPIGRVLPNNFIRELIYERLFFKSISITSIRDFDESKGSSFQFYELVLRFIKNAGFNTAYSEIIDFISNEIRFEKVIFKTNGQNAFFHCQRFFSEKDVDEYGEEMLKRFKSGYEKVINHMILMGEEISFYDPNKAFQEQDIKSTAPIIFAFWVDEIFLDLALPYLEFNFHFIKEAQTNFKHYKQYLRNPSLLMGEEFDRVRIAESIVSSQEGMTQEIQDRITFLKTHIRNEFTSIEWVQKFLASITGSITANSSGRIKVKGIPTFRLPTAHTCIKTLVLFNGPHEEYRYLPEETEISDSERFIQSITDSLIGQSTGFGFV